MKKETFEQQKPFAVGKKASMNRRCLDHDYKQPCMYLITMTTEGRRPLFGRVEGFSGAPVDSPDAPHIVASPLGMAVTNEWMGIPGYYPQIKVIAFQLMPDHLHGILWVREPLPVHLSKVLNGFKTGCNRHYRALFGIGSPSAATFVATQSQHTAHLPGQQAAPRRDSHPTHGQLFSPGFNDKILFRQGQLDRWCAYLRDNPRRLLLRREHPDYLRVHRDVLVAGIRFSAIGNLSLLSRSKLLQVQLSRHLDDHDVKVCIASFLQSAREGAVLVSPKISKGEKAVLNAAFLERLPLIVLQENGFTDIDKPVGANLMNACAEGRLLLLAPWPHHNERIKISREQCLALNAMAKAICQR